MHAIVLAAGASSRMGSPKALTRVGHERAVERVTRVAREAGLSVIVVTRAGIELPPLDARVVENPDPDAGRTGSLQVGLRARGGGRGAEGGGTLVAAPTALRPAPAAPVVVWPIDHPLASLDTVRALLDSPGEWVLPTHLGRTGHPILLRGERVLDAVMRAAPTLPLRSIPPQLGVVPARVAVEDPGILANLDTPDDLARLTIGVSSDPLR